MGLETEPEPRGVYLKGHFCVVGTYPIGIDPDVFDECLRKPHVQTRISELRMKFAGKKVIIGVDRLDYIKGMPHKLSALELFFIRYPQWRNKVVLIQIAVPSRTSVMQYKLLCSEVNELVGRINGSFGSFEFMPIHYLFQSVNLDELTALYTISDACIITSIRDGMNLVSYEYVACQRRHCGVLILSEFAGAAQTLTSAIRVNPWDSEEVADAIHRALTMPFPERQMREKRLFSHVSKNSASAWGLKFVNEMVRQAESSTGRHELVSSEVAKKIIASYREAKKRLIITDYGGTLVTPRAPTDSRPSPRVRKLLSALAKDPGTEVFLLSVRSCAWISQWFGGLKLGAFAEDGGYVSWPGSSIWEAVNQLSDDSWKEDIKLIMDEFASVTPGAYTRVMSNSMVWDYADVDPDFGSWQASYLERRLFEHVVAKSLPLQICSGRHELKVRPSGAGKGDLVRNILKHFDVGTFDFILCLGDDVFDEDMFVEVKKTAIPSVTCRVRNTVSKADYYLPSIHKAIELLETLCSS
jgi:trehalose 6-phosphate synthase/phosphatase